MRRKEQLTTTPNRGRSLISTRIQQHQQRKMQNIKKSQLPRSYSSPARNSEVENKGTVTRSFSSPDPKQVCYRRNSDTTSLNSKPEFSRSEFDSDLENYELFEESFIDIDAEPDDITFGAYTKNPEIDGPKKVVATLLPGSGLQKITMKPISPRTIQKIQSSRQAKRKNQRSRDDNKATNLLNFRPLVLKMPRPRAVRSEPEHSLGEEELIRSPSIEVEGIELEKQLDSGEQHLDAEIAIATAEDTDNEEAATASGGNNERALTLWRAGPEPRAAGSGRDDASADGAQPGFRVRSFADGIRVIGGQRDSEVHVENIVPVGAATPGHRQSSSFRGPAPTPTRLERPTTDRATATCSSLDMGNVQCCASDRFDENKLPKKSKSKGKTEKKPPKSSSEKTNGLSGDKGDGGVQKVVIVAEEASDRPAPASALAQEPSPAPATQEAESQAAGTTDEHDGSRSESMAVARERFFGQVRSEESLLAPEKTTKSARWIPEFKLDGNNSLKHNGSAKDLASVMENLKKSSLVSRQNQTLNTQVTSSSSQQMVSSTTSSSAATSQRLQSSSQRLQHMTASEMKASSMKSDLTELKSSISEMKNLSSCSALNFGQRLRSSMENIVDQDDGHLADIRDLDEIGDYSDMGDIGDMGSDAPLVTFPESDTPPPVSDKTCMLAGNNVPVGVSGGTGGGAPNELKYSAARVTSASSTRVVADGYSASRSAANSARLRRLQHGDLQYAERSAAGASHRLLQAEGLTAEQNDAYLQEQRSLKAGEVSAQEANNMSASSSRLQTEAFSAEKKAVASAQARQTVTSSGMFSHKEHSSVAHSNMTISSKNLSTKSTLLSSQMSQLLNGTSKPGDEDLTNLTFEDLDKLNANSNQKDVELAIQKYSSRMNAFINSIKNNQIDIKNASVHFNKLNEMMRRAWAVPTYGHELGYSLCNTLRTSGGLDILMENCLETNNPELQFSSAKLLEQCLTTENRAHVVENGLEKVVNVACVCTKYANSVEHSRIRTGILEHLFKHSEGTCSDVIKLGGLDAVLFECRKNDIETLRHCATALANLSLYGGAENQEAMIKRKVPMWLFPLAFHTDDNVKYYACLAIAVLVANKEIEAAVLKSGTLDLVEPFVTSHNPSEFAKSNLSHAHGQSKNWLQKLVPVLSSKREEARNLAAFHFCMEAGIKKQQGNTEIFREIGAIESLKKVASCPNAVASKYAAQALRLIGEEVPHKLSQQVPLWSIEDVKEWVKQIGFSEYANNFQESRVDGDLLLQISEDNLKEDIGLLNGIKRKRFTRELQQLKKMADYSSRDTGSLNEFLQTIGPEYTIYTYSMLNAGVDKESMRGLSDEQLENECRIVNSIHRLRILNAIRVYESTLPSKGEENMEKNLDVFVSYRRSNGSQLASLLKVHLQLRGFTVFIDVERLEAGKFDNNLLQSIRHAKNFLLVLTPNALERCKHDTEQKDWVHREIVAALQSKCNIVPIIDNFEWPEPEELPEDMRAVCHFNGVRWIHDYQDACVEKLESFLRGKSNLATRLEGGLRGRGDVATPGTAAIGRGPPSYQRMASCESRASDKAD